MPTSMTATDARKDFFNLIKAAGKPGKSIIITREGMPNVVMMSAEEFEGWMETLEIMSDPVLLRDVRRAQKEPVTLTLEDFMKEEHAQKPNVQSRIQKVGRKAVARPGHKYAGKGGQRTAGNK